MQDVKRDQNRWQTAFEKAHSDLWSLSAVISRAVPRRRTIFFGVSGAKAECHLCQYGLGQKAMPITNWVECCSCSRWRILPRGKSATGRWKCHQNGRVCHLPDDQLRTPKRPTTRPPRSCRLIQGHADAENWVFCCECSKWRILCPSEPEIGQWKCSRHGRVCGQRDDQRLSDIPAAIRKKYSEADGGTNTTQSHKQPRQGKLEPANKRQRQSVTTDRTTKATGAAVTTNAKAVEAPIKAKAATKAKAVKASTKATTVKAPTKAKAAAATANAKAVKPHEYSNCPCASKVPVQCNQSIGEYCLSTHQVLCGGRTISPTAFEVEAGSNARRWRQSLCVLSQGMPILTLAQWLRLSATKRCDALHNLGPAHHSAAATIKTAEAPKPPKQPKQPKVPKAPCTRCGSLIPAVAGALRQVCDGCKRTRAAPVRKLEVTAAALLLAAVACCGSVLLAVLLLAAVAG